MKFMKSLALIAMLNHCCLCRPAEEGDAAKAEGDNAKENGAAAEGDKQPAADAKMQSPPQFVRYIKFYTCLTRDLDERRCLVKRQKKGNSKKGCRQKGIHESW